MVQLLDVYDDVNGNKVLVLPKLEPFKLLPRNLDDVANIARQLIQVRSGDVFSVVL